MRDELFVGVVISLEFSYCGCIINFAN